MIQTGEKGEKQFLTLVGEVTQINTNHTPDAKGHNYNF